MTIVKKFVTYALLFTATFSLTAISCEDLSEDLTVDVPTDVTKTIRIATTEVGNFSIVNSVDIASDEFKEKREQMKNYSLESVEFTVVDNIPGGSANPSNTKLKFYAGGSTVTVSRTGATLQEQLALTVDNFNSVKRIVDAYVISKPVQPMMDITFEGSASAPMDYTITLKMTGIIEASVN